MARRAFVVNQTVREKVRHLAGVGVRQDDIAKIIGCAPKTLRKRCREDPDRGVAEANAMVSGCLFASAKGGNVTAQIFWLKSRALGTRRTSPMTRLRAAMASRIPRWCLSCRTTSGTPN